MVVIVEESLSAPERTYVQRMDALLKANDTRSRRKVLKRDLKTGRQNAVDVLVDPPEWAETMKVMDVLLAVPKVGRVKAIKLLSQPRLAPSKTLGGITERQRRELAEVLRRRS